MARQKKSEIDAILEQLKSSYFDDSHDMDEDSPIDEPESEEDAELAAVLEKIFTESEDKYAADTFDVEADEPAEEAFVEDETVEEIAANDVLVENKAIEEMIADEQSDGAEISAEPAVEVTAEVTAEESVQVEDIKSEEDRVDDVLRSMFHVESFESEQVDEIEPEVEKSSAEELESVEEEHADEQIGTYLDAQNEIECDTTDELIPDVEAQISEAEIEEANISGAISECINELEEEMIIDAASVSNDDIEAFCDGVIDMPDDVVLDELEDIITDENKDAPVECEPVVYFKKKKMITEPDEYINDPMQYSLSEIPFFKPQGDINFSIFDVKPEDEHADSIKDSAVVDERTEQKSELTDKDISLLMKLGYNGEINASGENDHAHKVLFDQGKDFVPENHSISHGFCGKEFSSRSQTPAIQKKFKQDKLILMIQAIIVSVLALSTLIVDIIAAASPMQYDRLASICIISSVAVLLVMLKQVIAGIYAIFKFDTNQYSLPSIVLIESILCHFIMWLIVSFGTDAMRQGSFYSVGGYALLYMAFTVWAEWGDCYRESGVFNFIAQNNRMYVAEKRTSADILYNDSKRRHAITSQEGDSRYIVKQAKFVEGFHRKTTGRSSPSRIFLIIGIIPAIATIMGMVVAIINDSLVTGISGMSFIFFLSAPLLGVASLSLIELLSYIKLRRDNAVLIGSDAPRSISGVRSLVFKDKDVIDIVAYTTINPNKKAENPQKWLNIASRVFEALGGPLSKIDCKNHQGLSNVAHDVAINSISDNGIDIYFDSSMNILIGDRAYMLAHNIKVKTDVNLTGATRGNDRTVIYMAFDKVPQIGFILTGKIQKSFLKILTLLSSSDINVEVKSYEPEVNEYFFEANLPEYSISTVKPLNYENTDASAVSDCQLAASSALDICRSVIYSRVVAKDISKNQKQRKLSSIIGFGSSILLGVLLCLPSDIEIISTLQECSALLFYLAALAISIPNIIHLIKVLKRK